jgi:ribosome recycling factor
LPGTDDILNGMKEKMTKSVGTLIEELATIRTGRANPNLLSRVKVDYYGVPTPIQQLATISTPEPKQLLISPFDKSALADVERALLKSDIGITPKVDGHAIRLIFPALTEERRKELAKGIKKKAEDAKVAVRNIRREANDHLKDLKKAGTSEDEIKKANEKCQTITDDFIAKLDKIAADKEKDIMTN